ncbi:hypothetical protein F442_11130, partial [Phytophthora nicotianae P10297]
QDERCREGKATDLEDFLCSLSQMSDLEKKQIIITSLAILMKTDTAMRRRGTGVPQVFSLYGGYHSLQTPDTTDLSRLTHTILNVIASKIDIHWLVNWVRSFAKTLGDVVPVRVRTQKTDQLYIKMHKYVTENEVMEPRPSTFRKLLQKHCPLIRTRSPRCNVCDFCSILYARMRSGVTAELTEELGAHTTAAKAMRTEYQNDLQSVSDDRAVIVMDFSQNLTLPSVTTTPSQWHILSLVNVTMFGIYYANKGIQYNLFTTRLWLLKAATR